MVRKPSISLLQKNHCYIIAEVGINHNGDMDLACRMIDEAAKAGADAVKFQSYKTEDFINDERLTWTYENEGRTITETQRDMFKRCELNSGQLSVLSNQCRKRQVDFAATPTGNSGIEDCVRTGAAFLKNGSDYLTHLPLIRAMAATGLPTILSTGMATEEEVNDAIAAFTDAGGNELILLHCVSLYPAPLETLDLRAIPEMARAFNRPVGFSDHSEGTIAAATAAALGAVAIERHFTMDKSLPGPDHRFSADPAELGEMIKQVRDVQAALGDSRVGYRSAEAEARQLHRLSCITSRAVSAGSKLTSSDIVFRRPGTGLPPKYADALTNQKLVRDVAQGQVLTFADFEPGLKA